MFIENITCSMIKYSYLSILMFCGCIWRVEKVILESPIGKLYFFSGDGRYYLVEQQNTPWYASHFQANVMVDLLKGWKQLAFRVWEWLQSWPFAKQDSVQQRGEPVGSLLPVAVVTPVGFFFFFFPSRIQIGMWSTIAVNSEVCPCFC